jgi:hypothetical protein
MPNRLATKFYCIPAVQPLDLPLPGSISCSIIEQFRAEKINIDHTGCALISQISPAQYHSYTGIHNGDGRELIVAVEMNRGRVLPPLFGESFRGVPPSVRRLLFRRRLLFFYPEQVIEDLRACFFAAQRVGVPFVRDARENLQITLGIFPAQPL